MISSAFFLLPLAILVPLVSCQTQSLNVAGLEVTWANNGESTDFILKSSLGNGVSPSNGYIGIGFGKGMNNVNTIICKSAPFNTVQHNYNSFGNSKPLSDPNVGLSNILVSVTDNVLKCSFTRKNSVLATNYYSVSSTKPTNLIGAYGEIQKSGQIRKHKMAAVSSDKVTFVARQMPTGSTGENQPEFTFPSFMGNFFDNLQCQTPKSVDVYQNFLENSLDMLKNQTSKWNLPFNIEQYLTVDYVNSITGMLPQEMFSSLSFQKIICLAYKYQDYLNADYLYPAYDQNQQSAQIKKQEVETTSEMEEETMSENQPQYTFPMGNFLDNFQCQAPRSAGFYDKMIEDTLDMLKNQTSTMNLPFNVDKYLTVEYIMSMKNMLPLEMFSSLPIQKLICFAFKYQKYLSALNVDSEYNGELLQAALYSKEMANLIDDSQDLMVSMWPSSMPSYDQLNYGDREKYFQDLAVVQEFVSSMDPASINLVLFKIRPELLTKLMQSPQTIHYVSAALKFYKP